MSSYGDDLYAKDVTAAGKLACASCEASGAVVGNIRATGAVPATAAGTGVAGDIRYAAGFLYVCVSTDTWQRVAIATWGA